MNLCSIVRVSSNQVSSDLNGEAAILNLKTGTYFGLDPVGATIWRLIAQPRTVESVREAMLERFDVDPGRCERDLLELLSQLNEQGLIEISDPEPIHA